MSKVVELYPLQPKQLEFANLFKPIRLYGGAKGGGKSYGMRAECVRQAHSAKKVRGLALRRTFPEIQENMITPMLLELPQEIYTFNASKGIMTFHQTQSTLRFSFCANYQDVLKYQGIEYDFICIEELTHWNEAEFDILLGCLRTNRQGIIPNLFASTNPGGKGHSWVKRRFIDRKFLEGEDPEEYGFVSANVWDNFVLMQSQPKYVKRLQSLPETLRKAYLEGDWNVFDGQYFKEFRDSIHVVPPFVPVLGVKRRIIALDYGYSNPSAVYWMAQMSDDSVIVYRELYVTKHTYKALALRIKAMTPANEQISAVIVDPAILRKPNEATGTSGEEEMRAAGLPVMGADNSRVKGWTVVRQFLQPYEDPNTEQVVADLKITESCPELIRTLPELIHDKTNVEDVDTSKEDHGPDALRYGLVFLGGKKNGMIEVKSANDAFLRQVQQKARDGARRGRSGNILQATF